MSEWWNDNDSTHPKRSEQIQAIPHKRVQSVPTSINNFGYFDSTWNGNQAWNNALQTCGTLTLKMGMAKTTWTNCNTEERPGRGLGKHLLTQGSKQLLKLKTRLGKWYTEPSMEWDSKIHTQTKTLWTYSRDTGVRLTHRDISHPPTRMKFDISIGSEKRQGSPPTDSLPCDVLQTGRIQFRLREHAAPLLAPTQQIYKVIIKELSFYYFRLLEHLHFAKSGKARLSNKIATDGSMQGDRRCSFGWCLRLYRKL